MKELSVNEQFKWPEQFLCVFKDFGVLQMAALIALFTIVCASIGSYGLYLMQFEENNARPYVVFGIPVMIMAGAIGFGTSLFAAVMVNQLIEGAAYKRSVFHPPELGALELLNSLLPVAVSFWAGMLPGIVFGQIIGAVFHRWWVSFVVAFATAFFLAPIGILSAYYNGSPFQIYSSEVVQTVRTKTSGWMRFYSWLGLWVFLYCVSAAFNFLPGGLLGIVLSAVAQTVFVVLIGRTIGLLAQSFINFWIDQDA
jgi:hypothetical protein